MNAPRKTLMVADLMTEVVMAVYPTDTLDAARIEMTFGHVRHLPVIDDEARVIGLVSQSELLSTYWRDGTAPVPVGPVMKKELRLVTAETPIQEAIALMIEHRVGCLPVVDGAGKLIGLLTETDFLRYTYREVAGTDYVTSWERSEIRF